MSRSTRSSRRVVPVVEALAGRGAVISVDTSKPEAHEGRGPRAPASSTTCGPWLVPGALEAAAETDCAVCLMHMQGEPRTMQANPERTAMS